MQLAGRGSEKAAVSAALVSVTAGGSRVLVLLGEAGIGKTALLDHAINRAQFQGLETGLGRATEHEADVPLSLFADTLPHALAPSQGDDPGRRWHLFRGLVRQFDRPETSAPLLLAFDDVHWADPASLELLEFLVRRPPAGRHLLVLALRPGPVAESLLTAARSSARVLDLLELAPLTREEAGGLLGGRTEAEAAELFAASGGNPLLLTELRRAGPGAAIPAGLQAAVAAELRQLGDTARALVAAGAILGDPFVVDTAAGVASLGQTEWTLALDELLQVGLLVPATSPRQFRFRHSVVRTAVYDAMSIGDRLEAHARAVEILEGAAAPPVERARHLAHSALPGDLAAARTLRQAAATLSARAPSISADWLLVAKRVSPPLDVREFSDLAEMLVQSGRLTEALAVTEEGSAFGLGSADDLVRLALAAASVERQLGRHESARRRLVRALEWELSDAREAELLAALALSAYQAGDYEALRSWGQRLHQLDPEDRVLRAVGHALLAMTLRFDGEPGLSSDHADAAIEQLRNTTDTELAAQAELATCVPWALVAVERFAPAADVSRRAASVARAAGNLSAAVALALPEVLALALHGRLAAADEAALQAETTARLTHNDQATQWALWARAWVLLERGRLREALAAATESVAIAERLDDSALAVVSRTVLGSILLADGRFVQAADLLGAYTLEPTWICRWSPPLVEALLASGRPEAAAAAARRATTLAAASGLQGAVASAHHAAGLVALAAGDRELALAEALTSIKAALSIEAEHDRAQGHLLAGRAVGSGAEAIHHLEQGYRLAEQCGAERTRAETVRELRRLGRRVGRGGPRAPGSQGVSSLSPREREIAELVAEGRTNREIAALLFLSEKTVESHLSKAFAKLDVSSRAALAASVAQVTGPSGG